MRFTTMRLCGGAALMAISAEDLDIDIASATEMLREQGHVIKQSDDMAVTLYWNGMETTVYPQGKVMFFPLKDKTLCVRYATEILGYILETDL